MNVIVIEDEQTVASELQKILLSFSIKIQVIARLSSVCEAVRWLSNNPKPDLVLADILLKDGIVFEVFNQVNTSIPIIYFTKYKEYALDSFSSNVVDYIIKPITTEKIADSIQKFLRLKSSILDASVSYPVERPLTVHNGKKILFIYPSSVYYFYLYQNEVYAQTKETRYKVNVSLCDLESELSSTNFYRANRRFIINRNSIRSIEQKDARKISLNLEPVINEIVLVSKEKAANFLRWLRLNSRKIDHYSLKI